MLSQNFIFIQELTDASHFKINKFQTIFSENKHKRKTCLKKRSKYLESDQKSQSTVASQIKQNQESQKKKIRFCEQNPITHYYGQPQHEIGIFIIFFGGLIAIL